MSPLLNALLIGQITLWLRMFMATQLLLMPDLLQKWQCIYN